MKSEEHASVTHRAMAQLLDTLDIGACLFDSQHRTVLWNDTFLKFFPEHAGYVYSGEPYRENLHRFYSARAGQDERPAIERYIEEGIQRHVTQSRPFSFTHRGRHLLVSAMSLPQGHRLRLWREIGSPAPAGPAIPGSEHFPIDLLEQIADGVAVLDPMDRIIATNAEFRALYDMLPASTAVGRSLPQIVQEAWQRRGLGNPRGNAAIPDNLRFTGSPFEVELPGARWRRVIVRRNADGTSYATHADITPLKHALDELSSRAATDGLTGLLNRRRFEEVLDEEWRRAARQGTPLSLLLLDIDNFKGVNDVHGHLVGDECLGRVARMISAAISRARDFAARFGGDEFVILLPGAEEGVARGVAEAIRAAALAEPWPELDPRLCRVTTSIGVCCARKAPGRPVDLLRHADRMLYQAKTNGRCRVEVHATG